MPESTLLPELIGVARLRTPTAPALRYGAQALSYAELDDAVRAFAAGLVGLGLPRAGRVGIYLEKRFETVIASFGAPAAGGVFVPMNPLLKPEQVAFIAQDCNVRVLVTSPERLALLAPVLAECPSLRHVVLTEAAAEPPTLPAGVSLLAWRELLDAPPRAGHRVIDTDMAAILYTSGSTGRPKGVVLSHRNMVAGAKSVASATWTTGRGDTCWPRCR
jgi:acyl-CoA synthetase (AMP-forming)/AMP-acid ligase II